MSLCCHPSNQTRTQIIAILEMVLTILLLLLLKFVGLAKMIQMIYELTSIQFAATEETIIVVSVMLTFLGLACLLFAVLLLVGAIKRNRTICMVWFVVKIIGLFLVAIYATWKASTAEEFTAHVFGILFNGISLWMVWEFMEELKQSSNKARTTDSRSNTQTVQLVVVPNNTQASLICSEFPGDSRGLGFAPTAPPAFTK